MKEIIIYTTLRALDIISTLIFVSNGATELNPLYNMALRVDVYSFILLNAGVSLAAGIVFAILWKSKLTRTIFWLFMLMNLLTVIMNLVLA
jgi:hypothetical protein